MSEMEIVEAHKSERHHDYSRGWRRGHNEYNKPPRVYFWVQNYNPIQEIFTGERYNKPYEIFRRYLPKILEELGVKYTKARWSQRAGCSCPCSPGFILEGVTEYPKFDVSVTYNWKEA